jgi:hypothetical protein
MHDIFSIYMHTHKHKNAQKYAIKILSFSPRDTYDKSRRARTHTRHSSLLRAQILESNNTNASFQRMLFLILLACVNHVR